MFGEISLIDYLYGLVDINKKKLDLTLYDQKHNFLKENFKKYIDIQKKLKVNIEQQLNILDKIYENIIYIPIDKIVAILDSNIMELKTTYKDYNHILVLSKYAVPTKSNFFFYLYFLHRYEFLTGERIKFVINSIYDVSNYEKCDKNIITYSDEIPIEFNFNKLNVDKNKKNLLIFCDDFSYSGKQLTENFNLNENTYGKSLKYDNNTFIFLNIIGAMKNTAIKLFNTIVPNNIIIPINAKIIPENTQTNDNIYSIINKLCAENNKIRIYNRQSFLTLLDFILEHDIYRIIEGKNQNTKKSEYYFMKGELGMIYTDIDKFKLSLVYLDFKYPDAISTLSTFCKYDLYNNNEYYLNFNEFKKLIFENVNINGIIYPMVSGYDLIKILYDNPFINMILPEKDYNNKDIINESILESINKDPKLISKYPWLIKYDKISDEDLNTLEFIDKKKKYLKLINNFGILLNTSEDQKNNFIDEEQILKKIDNSLLFCNEVSIIPFYKSINYSNMNISPNKKNILISNNKNIYTNYIEYNIKILKNKICVVQSKYNKYKNKYLEIKSKF